MRFETFGVRVLCDHREIATALSPKNASQIAAALNREEERNCQPRRKYKHGVIKLLARSAGYCMVRYPGLMVWVMKEAEWDRLPKIE